MKCLVWTAAVYGAETVDADTSGQITLPALIYSQSFSESPSRLFP